MGRWSEGRDGKGGIGMVKGGEEAGTGRWSECRDGEGGNRDGEGRGEATGGGSGWGGGNRVGGVGSESEGKETNTMSRQENDGTTRDLGAADVQSSTPESEYNLVIP
ncbi:hypothetical protein CBR_g45186 [Chara braunii]|uniref:Uncharacterized protein n=1 Tax=Chara braunii TaxID=69332 RepID=A0A388K361_CHABU|nr:hypothetical protein CBR_g45186 [Chara braunii]|eukprot:GBG64490.1 hypothetical protein CBR_g45186 [Chara braunii]